MVDYQEMSNVKKYRAYMSSLVSVVRDVITGASILDVGMDISEYEMKEAFAQANQARNLEEALKN